MNSVTARKIADEAISWVGTPYRHSCMQKGRGVDCARFAIRPYQAAGLIEEGVQVPIIARDRLLAGEKVDPDLFRNFILRYAVQIPFESRAVADLVTFFVLGVESHVGIIVERDPDYFVDAVSRSRVRKRRLALVPSVAAVYRHKDLI